MINEILVYVEGPSDKIAMRESLVPLIKEKEAQGIAIDFIEAGKGDRKKFLLTKVPEIAVKILLNKPQSSVVALPDLYPRHKAFPHETAAELYAGIRRNFEKALRDKIGNVEARYTERFHVFCFKHDLEALLLAAEDALRSRLGAQSLKVTWIIPVEDQNHNQPPKRIVERLFGDHGQRYKDTIDAPLILSACNYQEIAAKCPQCFKPFVDFLESL